MTDSIIVLVTLASVAWAIWRLCRHYHTKSPLDNVPGPARSSFLTGNMRPLFDRQTGHAYQQELSEKYGAVAKIHGLLGTKTLYISDSKALQHIFRESSTFIHTPFVISSHTVLFGPGLLSTEGAYHRMQRKLLNPVFTSNVMRELTSLMFHTAYELRDAMTHQLKSPKGTLDVGDWMAHTALESVGRVGLGHSFGSFHEVTTTDDNVAQVVKQFAPSIFAVSTMRLAADRIERFTTARLRRFIAPLIPSRRFQAAKYHVETLHTVSKEIFQASKASMKHEGRDDVEHKLNLMSILLKANDGTAKGEKLSDEELIAQIRTFIFAGTDTTSNILSRILHILAERPNVQDRLREEIRAAKDLYGPELSYDQLNELSILDGVCRETLRLYTAVNFALRYAAEDSVISLSTPITGADGKPLSEIVVPKGTEIIMHFQGCNRNKAIWGEDALEWKPERWAALPLTVVEARIPGVMSNLMSFGGGPHSCIGYRFSMLEIKAVLFIILNSLKFSLTGDKIFWNYGAINFPTMSAESSQPSLVLHVESV